jgi:hypothetical protein
LVAACHRGGHLKNLPLSWRGVNSSPKPSVSVARAFAAAPFAVGVRDVRPDPTAVGVFQDNGFVVRTSDNVAQYCSTRLGEMLARAGARLNEPPLAVLEAELLEYNVAESGAFNGLVRVRAVLRRGSEVTWTRIFEGTSKHRGRSHSPENYNAALSNAFASVTEQLVRDDGFARALGGEPVVGPPPQQLPPSGRSGG